MSMGWLQIFRLVTFGFSIFCGIIVASLSAHLTAFAEENYNVYYTFCALGIAVGALNMITLPIMMVIDFVRTGAFTSWVVVELSWLSILWVLWIATGALTANSIAGAFDTSCNFVYPIINQICHETQAIEAFSFLAWIVLLAYTITLLVVAIIAANRGSAIWTSSVKQYTPAPAAPQQNAAFAPQQMQMQQQQQPLMPGMSPPPAQQQLYQPAAYTPGQQIAPQPVPSPASQPSHASYPSQVSYGSGQPAYPQV